MGKLDKFFEHLPADLSEKLESAIEDGRYGAKADIVLDALYLWYDQECLREVKLEKLKALVAEARNGPYYSAEEVFAELRERVAAHAAEAAKDQ